MKYHVGASRILKVADEIEQPRLAAAFLRAIWSNMDVATSEKIIARRREVRVSGANLITPDSWDDPM